MHQLGTKSRTRPKRADLPDARGGVSGLFAQLAQRAVRRRFIRFCRTGRNLPERRLRRMTILANQNELAGRGHRQNRERRSVLHHVNAMFRAVAITQAVDPDVEDAPFEDAAGIDRHRNFFHRARLGGTSGPALVAPDVPKPRSSVSVEIAWLIYFLAVFVAAVYLLVRTLVP